MERAAKSARSRTPMKIIFTNNGADRSLRMFSVVTRLKYVRCDRVHDIVLATSEAQQAMTCLTRWCNGVA